MTVLLSAGAATLLAALTVIGLSQEYDSTLVVFSAFWWGGSVVIGIWLGRRNETSPPIRRLLLNARSQTTLPELRPGLTLLNRLWPLLGSTLALVATAGGAARGALLLGLFGLGAALPLVAAAYASRAGFGRMRARVLAHAGTAKRAMGGLLLLVGVLILTGGDHAIEAWVNERLPDAWLALTTRI